MVAGVLVRNMPNRIPSRFVSIFAAAVLAIGTTVLLGWVFEVASLKSVVPGWPKMSPATLLAVLLASVSLILSGEGRPGQQVAVVSRYRRSIPSAFAIASIAIGSMGIVNSATGIIPGLAMLGMQEQLAPGETPAAISLATSLAVSMIGAARILSRRYFHAFQSLAIAAVLISAQGYTQYLYGGAALLPFGQMSILTATCTLLLSVGCLFLRTDRGLMALFASDSSGGWLLRHGLLPSLALPFLIGWARLRGQEAGWFGTEGGAGLFAASSVVLIGGLFWGAAILLNRADRLRRKSETISRQLAAIVESSRDAIIGQNLDGRVTSWNRAAESLFGHASDEMIGNSLDLVVPLERRNEEEAFLAKARQGLSVEQFETARNRKDGRLVDVSLTSSPIFGASGEVVGISKVVRDISLRMAHEREILRISRLYSALSHVNQAIIGIDARDELFARVCRVLVEFGGFRSAWIGLVNSDSGRIDIASTSGDAQDHVEALLALESAESDCHGSFSSVTREGRVEIYNDLYGSNREQLRQIAKRAGYLSLAGLPIKQVGAVIGLIGVFADETEVFQGKEIALLNEVATDVSFALDKILRNAKHAEAEAALHRGEESVRRSEERYRTLFDYAPDGIVIADPESYYLDANRSICRMLGYSRMELIGMHAADIVMPDALDQVAPALSLINSGSDYQQEWRFRRKDGSTLDADVHVTVMPDGNLLGIIRDISERKLAELKIERANRLYSVLSGINELIVRASDRKHLLRDACHIAVERGRFPMAWVGETDGSRLKLPLVAWVGEAEAYRKSIEAKLQQPPMTDSRLSDAVSTAHVVVINEIATDPRVMFREEAVAAGFASMVALPLTVAGKLEATFAIYSEQVGFFDDDEMALLNELADDISFALDHIQKSERLEYLAYYDALTGLANRSLLLQRLEQNMGGAVSGKFNLALILVDLERFKNINDSLGQVAGDELLKQVAQWLADNAGGTGLLAHLDADRFAIVMPEARRESDVARFLVSMIVAFQDHPFHLEGGVFRIAAKFGVAMFPGDGGDAATLYRNAESALKKAKAGSDRYLFYAREMSEKIAGKLSLENALRQALENDEFELHYQPKVERESGRLVGAEALLRWNDPLNGTIPPDQFVPVLEEIGLIKDVGRWALGKAFDDSLRWKRLGLPALRVAVNVSPLQLRDQRFVEEVRMAISACPEAADGLELEITESVVMQDLELCISSLKAIRAMGLSVAIDDFGTGFSSLAYLIRLPVDTLKIDRLFVANMAETEDGRALVSTIIALAGSLKLQVVAEGVETLEQARILSSMGCDVMQGFLFGRPMPRAEFEAEFVKLPM